jgi:hypothetical protein
MRAEPKLSKARKNVPGLALYGNSCRFLRGIDVPASRGSGDLSLLVHEALTEGTLGFVLIVRSTPEAQVGFCGLAPERDWHDMVKLLWNDLSSRHVFSFVHVSGCWLFDGELKTTDEAGRFDDESLCYARVVPVARHRAA